MSIFSLKNKTAIITGGGSGIGKAISGLFVEQGVNVHVLEYDKENIQALEKEFKGLKAHFCDVSKHDEVEKIIKDIASEGKIDILINNAGVAHIGNIENTTEEDLDRIYAINIKGLYNCSKAVIPVMKIQKHGVILNMASIAASVGISDRFAYSMSKGAVLTMTMSIAKDYLDDGIRCNCISPARVHTPFVDGFISKNYPGKEEEMFEKLSRTQPVGRMGQPEEIAKLALYLCSDEASFITGNDYPIDGGFIKLQG
jgi:NAD(P)-dependent dehydrogenase (short-subunit alcohol dehydrogenase family)